MEKFFQACGELLRNKNSEAVILSRLHGIYAELMHKPFEEGFYYCRQILDEVQNERLYAQWLAYLPMLIQSNKFMSFSQFKEEITGANIDMRPAEDILAEVEEIRMRLHGDKSI